jgi:hypothetical protein
MTKPVRSMAQRDYERAMDTLLNDLQGAIVQMQLKSADVPRRELVEAEKLHDISNAVLSLATRYAASPVALAQVAVPHSSRGAQRRPERRGSAGVDV